MPDGKDSLSYLQTIRYELGDIYAKEGDVEESWDKRTDVWTPTLEEK